MPDSFSPQQVSLLALVPIDGTAIGNGSLREQLGWAEDLYKQVRDELVMGRWAFHVCKDPDVLRTEIEYLNTQPIE